jgi:tape measure domain-containing protein
VAETLGNAVLVLGIDDDPFRAGLDQAKRVAGTQGVQIGNSFARSVSSAIAAFGLGVTAVNFLKGSIDSAVELETITRKLSNTLGEQGAARALGQTRRLSDELGLSFTTLAGTFGSFTAAASAAGTPLKVQEDLFAAVARSAQALGLSNDELSGSLLALQQIASKGNVQMEELRGQLGERLPIAFSAAAKGLGVTQQELIKLVESGRLTAGQFFPALTKGLNELTAAAGGAPTAAQNFQKLGNAWKDLQTSFGQNLLPTVIQGVETLTKILQVQGDKNRADQLGFGTGLLGNLGIFKQEALNSVVAVKSLQQQLNLTDKQANALFTDAQKDVGIKNIGLAKPEQVDAVLSRFRELAKLWREKYPDRQAELEGVAAATAAAALAEKNRLNTVGKISDKIKELQTKRTQLDINSDAYVEAGQQIKELQKKIEEASKDPVTLRANTTLFEQQTRLSLDNLDQQIAKAKELAAVDNQAQRGQLSAVNAVLQSITAAKDQQKQLTFELENQFTTGAPTETVRATLAESVKAGKNVELSLINGARQLRDILNDATQRLSDALTSNFDILNSEGKAVVLERARQDVIRGVQTGFIDPTKIPGQQDAQAFIQFASQSKAIADAFSNLKVTQDAVVAANAQLETSQQAVVGGMSTLGGIMQGLVEKSWAVNVRVDADGSSAAYGDVLNRAI